MSEILEKEEADLKQTLTEIQKNLSQQSEQSRSANEFADLIEKYAPITKLDREILNTLIEKIVICENSDENSINKLTIDVYYRFIGIIC